jgi:Mrp family chromosome partitioning ATPase/capsular polysaccharide biosynthesis protein
VPHRSFLRAHLALIAFITLLTVGGAFAATVNQPAKYTASSSVVVRPQIMPNGGVQLPDMVTEKQVALSGAVAHRAADLLPTPSGNIRAGLGVSVPIDSSILNISYTASTARSAYIGASVYTRAYVEYSNQLAAAGGARSDLHPVTQVITSVAEPTAPVGRHYPLIIGLALVIGLGLAFATALARDRMTGRVRNIEQVQDLVGHPVLGRISAGARMRRRVGTGFTGATAPGAEVYGQLAARFLREAQHVPTATLVVTSAVPGPGKSAVALNIAAALANAGRETVLVRPDLTAGSTNGVPGHDRVDAADGELDPAAPLMFRTEMPRLSVAAVDLNQLAAEEPVGDDATAVHGLKRSLQQMERTGRLIVVEADPLLGHQLTPLITASADAMILVVDLHRDTSRDLAEAGSVLAHADRVLGCVVYDPGSAVWGRLAGGGHTNGNGSGSNGQPGASTGERTREWSPSPMP